MQLLDLGDGIETESNTSEGSDADERVSTLTVELCSIFLPLTIGEQKANIVGCPARLRLPIYYGPSRALPSLSA